MLEQKTLKRKNYSESNIEIRIANRNDLNSVFYLIDQYVDEDSVNVKINREKIYHSACQLLFNSRVMIAEKDKQIIGAMSGNIIDCAFSNDVMFSSSFLYVIPRFRHLTRSFIKEIERCLSKTEVTRIVIGVPNFKNYHKQKRFMRICGFSELETHMQKIL